MKFWELTSAFRSETDNLKKVFSKDRWIQYREYYNNLNAIIQRQDRQVLDEEVPFELAKEVCELSRLKFYLYFKNRPHRLTTWKQGTDEPFEEVTALDILYRFGGSFIEETLERSISEVLPGAIGENIEVLSAFDLTNIGMLAILRTENDKIYNTEIICSLDNSREWQVIKEAIIYVNPYSAFEKNERQKEQGIRQYVIKPIKGTTKPLVKEILKRKINSGK